MFDHGWTLFARHFGLVPCCWQGVVLLQSYIGLSTVTLLQIIIDVYVSTTTL